MFLPAMLLNWVIFTGGQASQDPSNVIPQVNPMLLVENVKSQEKKRKRSATQMRSTDSPEHSPSPVPKKPRLDNFDPTDDAQTQLMHANLEKLVHQMNSMGLRDQSIGQRDNDITMLSLDSMRDLIIRANPNIPDKIIDSDAHTIANRFGDTAGCSKDTAANTEENLNQITRETVELNQIRLLNEINDQLKQVNDEGFIGSEPEELLLAAQRYRAIASGLGHPTYKQICRNLARAIDLYLLIEYMKTTTT